MPDEYLLRCLEVIRIHGGGQPALFNDGAVIPSQLAAGVPLQEAYDYAIDGCVEPCEPGKGMKNGCLFSTMNLLKVLELSLNNGKDPETGIQLLRNPDGKDLGTFRSFEDLISAYKSQVKFYIQLQVTGINCVAKAFAELTPCPYASALTDDCIERGLDIEWGGGRYNSAGMLQVGTSNTGNSLAALKRTLFEDKTLSAEQIGHALQSNFEDSSSEPPGEKIRRILLDVPKYGNDDDFADLLVKEVFEFAAEEITNHRVWTTGARCTTEEGHVTAHIALGKLCGAAPDGRKAGTPVNEGLSPAQGTDVQGPTATLKSVAKLNHTLCAGGTLLNQKFNPVVFESAEQLRKLASLLRTYFALGGMHIQCNVISAEVLRDAQKHPENYPNLLIRIAGYSASFTSLERAIQDEIISRSEQRFS
jgi:formate C-acetyltransferase